MPSRSSFAGSCASRRDLARGAIADVIAHEGADHGLSYDGAVNGYGGELDELADALGLWD